MTTLLIKDLSVTADLDRSAMAAVRGGTYKGMPAYCLPSYDMPGFKHPVSTFDVNASQLIGQTQNVVNNNGNNAAFVSGITSTVNPTQTANNSISF